MGIFTKVKSVFAKPKSIFGKTPEEEDEEQKEIERLQELAKKKDIFLPPSPEEQPKRGLLEKVGGFLGAFETAPAVEALFQGENPFTAYKESVKKGLTAQENLATKKSYSDVLETAGWQTIPGTGKLTDSATWANMAREVAGLFGDIVLDPTTYLTFGVGKGIQLEAKAGTKVLTKSGEKVYKSVVKSEIEKVAQEALEKGVVKTEKEVQEQALKNAGEQVAKMTDAKLFDKGGVKYAGKTIIAGETIKKPVSALVKMAEADKTGAEIVAGLTKIKDVVGKTFYRDYNLPEKFVASKQEYLDLYNKDADDIVETIAKTFKNVPKEEREKISFAIEANDLTGLSEHSRSLAEQTKAIFADIAKVESDRGLLDYTLKDYVPHIYKDKEKAQQVANFVREGVRADSTKFSKVRTIPTIAEAERLGLMPEKDVAKLLSARLLASAKAIREQDLLQKTAKEFGVNKKGAFKSLAQAIDNDLVEYQSREMKGLVIPRVIADDLAKLGKNALNTDEAKAMLRGFDAIQNFFKGSLTSLFPAFHGRNFISNVAQNFLDVGVKAIDPVFNMKALNILKKGTKGKFSTKIGTTYTYDELRKVMKERGILGSPGRRDVKESVGERLEVGLSRKLGGEAKRLFTPRAIPFRAGRAVGGAIEDHARAMNFLSNLDRGLSIEQSAQRTKQFLFDYDNLSNFEKTVAKRAIPFYTWTRKNIELQARTLFTRPRMLASQLKAQRLGSAEAESEREHLPEYISQRLSFRIEDGITSGLITPEMQKSGVAFYLAGLGLPLENFFENLPQGISVDDMKGFFGKVASQSAFVPKFFAELTTGHDFYRDKPIKEVIYANEYNVMPQFLKDWLELKEKKVDYTDDEGRRIKYTTYIANPYKLHLLRALPSSRAVATIGGIASEDLTMAGKLLKNTTGVRIYSVDIGKMEEKEQQEYLDEIEQILINYGEVAEFRRTWIPKESEPTSIFKTAPATSFFK